MAYSPTTKVVFSRIEHALHEGLPEADQQISIAARDLLQWAWLAIELSTWLTHASPATRAELDHRLLSNTRTAATIAMSLEHISDRLSALLLNDTTDRRQR